MALEVKVFREITEYQAKVIFGLSWRQAGSLLIALPILVGAYALFYWYGLEDAGVVVVTLLVLPAAGFGWVRPMGIPFEKYIGYFWSFRQGRKYFHYQGLSPQDLETGQEGEAIGKQEFAQALPRRSRRARRKFAAFEATN